MFVHKVINKAEQTYLTMIINQAACKAITNSDDYNLVTPSVSKRTFIHMIILYITNTAYDNLEYYEYITGDIYSKE